MLLHVTREAFLFISACMLTYSYRARCGGTGTCTSTAGVSPRSPCPTSVWTVIYFVFTLPQRRSSPRGRGSGTLVYLVATGYYQLYYLLVIMRVLRVVPAAARAGAPDRGHHGPLLAVSLAVQVPWSRLMHWKVFSAVHARASGPPGRSSPTSSTFWPAWWSPCTSTTSTAGSAGTCGWCSASTVAAGGDPGRGVVRAGRPTTSCRGWARASDPLQPIVIPFNIGAIASIYLLGVFLVDRRRSPTTVRAVVRSGSDDSYGVYLAQMIFVTRPGLDWAGSTSTVSCPGRW